VNSTGALVISLDFELRWGVHDHCPPGSPYERSLFGARDVVLRTLALFEEFGVAATWATVGFLFARSDAELERFRPPVLPAYRNARLSPYAQAVGKDEVSDPLHFAPSLIEQIMATPRQEVGTHTYSHYYCNEEGQTEESFRADLQAACAIAASWGVELRSIVFPRNQVNSAYAGVMRECGILAYRGNPESWMWRFSDREESAGGGKRAARLLDAYLNVGGHGSVGWEEIAQPSGLADVRASHFVRPTSARLRQLEPMRLRRMCSAVRDAARRKRIVHLWWHPHNFGADQEGCLRFLRGVLEEYRLCQERYGMQSLTMAEVTEKSLPRELVAR
jgi:peptidoglycan/xylan/chitin deacetylase (PgdA/CDA1 family)